MSSLIREVVKDMEDMHGDARYACRTMPIVWGVRASKIFTSVWIVVLFFSVFALAVYSFIIQRWIFGAYLTVGVMLPLLVSLFRLRDASDIRDYRNLSRLVKFVMRRLLKLPAGPQQLVCWFFQRCMLTTRHRPLMCSGTLVSRQ